MRVLCVKQKFEAHPTMKGDMKVVNRLQGSGKDSGCAGPRNAGYQSKEYLLRVLELVIGYPASEALSIISSYRHLKIYSFISKLQ